MGSTFFRKLQAGVETAHGTAVAADTMIVNAVIPPVTPDRQVHRPAVNAGVRSESVVGHEEILQHFWQETLTIEDGYFQILPLLLSLGIKGGLSPAEQTVGEGDWLWDFDPNLDAAAGDNALDSITLELGDDDQAYEVPYVMANSLRIQGTINQGQEASVTQIEANLFGRELTESTFTGGLSIPSTQLLNAGQFRLYKDSLWTGLGTTELANILRGFDLELAELAHGKQLGTENKYFAIHGQGLLAARLGLTVERGAASEALRSDFWNTTSRALRLELDSGVQIGAGVNHKLTIDMIGSFNPVTPMAEEDRSNLIDVGDFVAMYDPTSGQKVRVQVITDVAAI